MALRFGACLIFSLMDFGRLLSRSGQLLWQHPFLWALGLLPGVSQVVSTVLRFWLTDYLSDILLPILTSSSPEALLFAENLPLVENLMAEFFRGEVLVLGTIWLFLALVGFWLLYTLTEAALIAATLHLADEQPISFTASLRLGWQFLGKFIAIDALVFFPWFILALSAMILAGVTVAATAGMSVQGASAESAMGVMAAGLGCVGLLACLLLPLSFVTLQFRALAFRETAVFHKPVREGVKHTWQIVKRNLTTVIILVAVLWGVDYLFGLVTSLITFPLGAATAVTTFTPFAHDLIRFASLAVSLLLALPKALLFVFISVAWTLAFLDLAGEENATGR